MTFHEPPLGPGPHSTPPGDGDDDFDPAIAARFSMLDQVPAPQTWPPKPQADNVRSIWPVWQSVGVAAAAAIVLAVAATALIPDRNDGGSVVVDAAEGPRLSPDEPAASDSPRETDDGGRSVSAPTDERGSTSVPEDERPTLSIAPDETTSETTAADPTETRPDPGEAAEPRPIPTTPPETRPTTSEGGGTLTFPKESHPTLSLPPDSRPTTSEVSPTLTFPKESHPTLSLPPESRPTITSGENEGQTIVVRGLVTEVFTDCNSRLVLNDDGEVERVGPVSCDGGSHIIVDGVRIQTSAGFVPADLYYDKHPRDLLPGQRAEVTAVTVRYGERTAYTLNCDRCGVSIVR